MLNVAQMESLNEKVHSVRAAIGQISTTTVITLNELLLLNKPHPQNTKPSKSTSSSKTSTRALSAKSKTKALDFKKISTHNEKQLSPKEKSVLATEFINATLKSLSEAIKTPTSSHILRKSSNDKLKLSRGESTRRQSLISELSFPSQSTRTRSSSFSNEGNKLSSSSSISSFGNYELRPTAECAIIAFACLRMLQYSIDSDIKLPPLQLENGMSVLITKLISLGMDDLATKELRILKRCLIFNGKYKKEPVSNNDISIGNNLVALLDFGKTEYPGSKLELVITSQLQILRIMTYSKKPKFAELALPILHPENPSSPTRLIIIASKSANESKKKEKFGRQLQSLSEILLSLCPSISLSQDISAVEPKKSVSPQVAIQLQSYALYSRILSWSLDGNKGDLIKDVYEPFRRCLSTFLRRSRAPNGDFSIAVQAFEILLKYLQQHPTKSSALNMVLVEIYKNLASFAKDALQTDAAIKWTNEALKILHTEKISDARLICVNARLVFLRLQLPSREPEAEEELLNLIENLERPFKGEISEIQELLIEVSNTRRATLNIFIQNQKQSENFTHVSDGLQEMCRSLIFLCPRLSLRYLGIISQNNLVAKEITRSDQKLQFISKISIHAVDSTLFLLKTLLEQKSLTWELLDSRLQDCLSLLDLIYLNFDELSRAHGKNIPTPSYHVKISNLYYTKFLNMRENQEDNTKSQLTRALRRSVDCIRNRPFKERKTALFTTKLERLAELYKDSERYDDLIQLLYSLRDEIIEEGVLSSVLKRAAHQPSKTFWSETREIAMLGRTIHSIIKIQLRLNKSATQISLYEDSWPKEQRAIILEHQFEILSKKSSTNPKLVNEIQHIILRELFCLYNRSHYPIRRLRVAVKLFSTGRENLSKDLQNIELEMEPSVIENLIIIGTEDEGLLSYFDHYKAMAMMLRELHQSLPRLEKINNCLASWSQIAFNCPTLTTLNEKIDDVIGLIAFLHTIADWLQLHGHEKRRVAVLRLVVELNEKCDSIINTNELILSYIVLGIQWLHLGYSGKAGLVLDRARTINQKYSGSSLVTLQLYISLCEYLITIGNINEAESNLSCAQTLFFQQKEDKQRSTLGEKVKMNILTSNAYCIHSKFALERGSLQSALSHAKQSVQILRRTWANIEDNQSRRKNIFISGSQSGIEKLTGDLSHMTLESFSKPSSNSQETYQDYATFWTIITPLFQSLNHLSALFAHHGMFQETVYYAEQAYKLAKQVKSDAFLAVCVTNLGNIWLRAGNLSKGSELLAEAKILFSSSEKNKNMAFLTYNLGMMNGLLGDYDGEISAYNDAIIILNELIGKEYISSIEKITGSKEEGPESQIPPLTEVKKNVLASRTYSRSKISTRGKLATQVRTRVESTSSVAMECPNILALRSLVMREKSRVLVHQKHWTDASMLLQETESTLSSLDKVSHGLALGKHLLLQSLNQMDADPVYSILQDSTISFPSVLGTSKLVRTGDKSSNSSSSPRRLITNKGMRERNNSKSSNSDSFFDKLRRAQDCLRDTLTIALVFSPVSVIYKTSYLLNSVAVLLSTAGQIKGKSIGHPGLSSLFVETARNIALRNERRALRVDPQMKLKQDGSSWPQLNSIEPRRSCLGLFDDNWKKFEREYIDIIPKTWTVISISLSESHHELSLIRLQSGCSPFILRLPLGRNSSIDTQEEIFDYEQGRAELREIVRLANKTAHDAGNRLGRDARLAWWGEREVLDARMKDLLENIERVWLGGFTGIFSQHIRRPELFGRFQKTFQRILDKYLPSRQKTNKRNTVPRITLDSRILDLFIGLGDASDEARDLSEPLTDLLYFVVDVLQFHGELNAYAEIDFDMIVLETNDALRCYHEAVHAANYTEDGRHTILILDKALHSFPWESLPCLDGLAVSRLPSLESLRERVITPSESFDTSKPDGYYIDKNRGSYILNPGGDLKHTLGIFQKNLKGLQGWNGVINREPTEDEFKNSLVQNDLFLYFGHGSGSQYIRAREIQKLPNCAVSILMGCSSGALTEAGEFEPYGPTINYLHAGSHALVATLWDVTDKDIDRFAKSTFENWGLFQSNSLVQEPMEVNTKNRDDNIRSSKSSNLSLVEAVAKGKKACNLRYLNAAAVCVYGVPVYFKS